MRSNDKRMKSTLFQFIFKIIIIHIAAIAAYLFLMIIFTPIMGETTLMYVLTTTISTLLYTWLCYLESWRTGERDHNLVKYGHIPENKRKGLIAGLICTVPGFILAVLIQTPIDADILKTVYKWIYIHLCYVVNILEDKSRLIYFLPIVISPVTAALGYLLGYKGIRVWDKIVYSGSGKDLR